MNKATFVVQVQFCENHSWQGSILWGEAKKEQHFRSTLEMLRLLEEALSSEQSPS